MGKALIINGADFSLVAIGVVTPTDPAPDNPGDPTPPPTPSINITSGGSVTITCENAVHIYYSTDGSTPTSGSTLYQGAFSVSNGTTVKAIAVFSDNSTSSVATGTYTQSSGDNPTPLITITSGGNVSITCPGAVGIYYTINGSTPTTGSLPYEGSFSISSGTTVKAIAVFSDNSTSSVATGTYTQSAWSNTAPAAAFENDDRVWDVSPGISFGYKSQIFDGSSQYSEVQISIKAARTHEGWEVILLEVPNPLPTSQYPLNKVEDLGTLDTVADTLVTETFSLPTLNSSKKYIVCLMGPGGRQYVTSAANAAAAEEELLSIGTSTSGTTVTYQMEYYDSNNHARGSFGYSFYQQKFR